MNTVNQALDTQKAMTTFRFNFSGEDNNSCNELVTDSNESIQWLESEEIIPGDQIKNIDDIVTRAKMFVCGDVEIGHLVVSDALVNIEESDFKNTIKIAEREHSDLIAGSYEGGLKIWECTYDLVEHLENQTDIEFENKQVLDLGCGAGILGIYALQKGSYVTFQDYNREVLEYFTIHNVLLNIEDENERENEIKKCRFFSGDWQSFNKKLSENELYDIILTSETIYNEDNYGKLISLFTQRLSRDGIGFVAAKTYYFGVGGGVRQFQEAIEKDGHLKSVISWNSLGGIQREILKIMHNKQQ